MLSTETFHCELLGVFRLFLQKSLTQDTQSESYESVDIIEKSNENLDGPEDKFGFNKTLWTPEESSRANGKKLKWLLVKAVTK